MPFYGVTITANHRTNNYLKDRIAIEGLINLIKCKRDVKEISDIGWELTKHKPHLLHCHFTIIAVRPPYVKLKYFSTYTSFFKLNINITKALKGDNLDRWVSYCHKADHISIEDAYEESYVPPSHRIIPCSHPLRS